MSSSNLARACALGAICGARTFTAPALAALHGRWGTGRIRVALPLVAAGELVGDKLPSTPPRTDPPALAGRVLSGAVLGGYAAGGLGAVAAGGVAAASAHGTQLLRAALGKATGWPDPVLGAAEDALVIALALAAIRA